VNISEGLPELDSEGLAVYIIDALLRAKILHESDVSDAIAIAAEEIHIRNISGELIFK
jgi:hypothetical protein